MATEGIHARFGKKLLHWLCEIVKANRATEKYTVLQLNIVFRLKMMYIQSNFDSVHEHLCRVNEGGGLGSDSLTP